ncbi:MAG: SRPBCC family protein [Thermoleophilaceae bacterium]|nr:SRPBCC family protein [Thermoleophilaceae bacterium]
MSVARASGLVPLPAARAAALWTDTSRWPTFVEGFAGVVQRDDTWPEVGGKLVWTSVPGGRGHVTERVLERTRAPDGSTRIVSEVLEEALAGMLAATFAARDDGCELELALDYELEPTTVWRSGPLGRITDLVFIRRALSDSLARTVRRFATEASEEAAL